MIFVFILSFCRIISSNRSHIVKLPLSRVGNQKHRLPMTKQVLHCVMWGFTSLFCLISFLSCDDMILIVIATEIHAHFPPVPAAQQPSSQGGSFPHCQKALRQHLCLPVSLVLLPPVSDTLCIRSMFFVWHHMGQPTFLVLYNNVSPCRWATVK